MKSVEASVWHNAGTASDGSWLRTPTGTLLHVQVQRKGLSALTRAFQHRSDAQLWARQREAEIDRGDLPVNTRTLRAHTLRGLLERYAEAITPLKRGADRVRHKLRVVSRRQRLGITGSWRCCDGRHCDWRHGAVAYRH
jgi:hypothetical protein